MEKEDAKGYPGPVLSDHLVFTVETKGKQEVVRAFDRKTGDQKWEAEWAGSMSVPFFAWKNGSWVRSTPVYDGENLYVGGMRDYLVCLDAKSGGKSGASISWKDTTLLYPPLALFVLRWSWAITSMLRQVLVWSSLTSGQESPNGAFSK